MERRADPGTAAKRPGSVTLAAVLLIGGGLLGAGALILMVAADPWIERFSPARQALGAAELLVRLIAGVGALRRWGWTRWLYAAGATPVAAYALVENPLDPPTIVANAMAWLTIALLTTPAANAWFRGSPKPDELSHVFR